MFRDSTFNGNIAGWNVRKGVSFARMFENSAFNQPLADWRMDAGQNFRYMFYKGKFNQPIPDWGMRAATDLTGMFESSLFNNNISRWNPTKVTSFSAMFFLTNFNQPIPRTTSAWNFGSGVNFASMFEETPFNQNVASWSMGGAVNVDYMFVSSLRGKGTFNQNLCSWGSTLRSTLTGPEDDANADEDDLQMFIGTRCLYTETLYNPTCSGGGRWTQLCSSSCDNLCYPSGTVLNVAITASGGFWDLYRSDPNSGASDYRWIASGFSGALSRNMRLTRGRYSLEGASSSATVTIQRTNPDDNSVFSEVITRPLNSNSDIFFQIP